jgi:transcriptional regulator GlxA family with amidase domain
VSIRRIILLVFHGFERLDAEGPCGVFGFIRRARDEGPEIRIISIDGRPVRDHLFHREYQVDGVSGELTLGESDLLLIPGGPLGGFQSDQALIAEVGRLGLQAGLVASVCTGAFLTAAAGLADGRTVVTHWQAREGFRKRFPRVNLANGTRYHVDGPLWSSAGISAGIDMALALTDANWGREIARRVRDLLEYFPEPPVLD